MQKISTLSHKHLLTAALAVIAVVKLLVISGNEIVSEVSDSVEYLLLAKAWFWGFEQVPIRGPGYPLYVAVLQLLGLPLRLPPNSFS